MPEARIIPLHEGRTVEDGAEPAPPAPWEEKAAELLAFLRRRLTGDYEVDDFGYDPEFTDVLMAAFRPLYDSWFRVETRGLDNIPDDGATLIVANHSGTIPLDAVMTQLAVREHHPARRQVRMLGADLVFALPVIAPLARKSGTTLACTDDVERLLRRGEVCGVFPEGFKGIGKTYAERYRLQRFGRGGFIETAMRAGVPVVPIAVVGSEEAMPTLALLPWLDRVLGVPYVPLTANVLTLGPLGLVTHFPAKFRLRALDPVHFDAQPGQVAYPRAAVQRAASAVQRDIQAALDALLATRRNPWTG